MINFNCSSEPVLIASGKARLAGVLEIPSNPSGVVLFTQRGSSRVLCSRSNYLADQMHRAGLATLLLELLSPSEDRDDKRRFDIELLGVRLASATDWLAAEPETKNLALGVFGSGIGAGAALRLAADRPGQIAAVVSRGGRPDLAGPDALARVRTPTLLIVDEEDRAVIELNRQALQQLSCEKDMAIIRSATPLCENQGALQEIARLAARWFKGYAGGEVRSVIRPRAC